MFIRRSFNVSSEIKGCINFGGLKEKQQGDLPHEREKEIQEKLMILNLSHGIISLLFIMKLVGNHLQEDQQNSCLQNSRKKSKQ